MSGRQVFSEAEKICLQELILKYKLHSSATIGAGNPAVKKTAWARLTEEYNSIETNTRRTEAQLKKCFDNLKNRKKLALAAEKKERLKTGGGPPPSTSAQDDIEVALLEATDVELREAIDSDMIFEDNEEDMIIVPHTEDHGATQIAGGANADNVRVEPERVQARATAHRTSQATEASQIEATAQSATAQVRTAGRRSGSRLSDYDAASSQTSVARNVRARVITSEFALREQNYKRAQEREEELHAAKMMEQDWRTKAAEELYKKAVLERQSAEEMLRCNIAKREAAEIELINLKK